MSEQNKYDSKILKQFNMFLKIFLPLALFGTIVIMILFNINMFDVVLTVFFVTAAVILILLMVFRTKVSTIFKVYTLVFLALLGSSLIILRVGLDAAGLIIYLMGVTIVFGLFSKRKSIIFVIASLIMLIITAFFTGRSHKMPVIIDAQDPLVEHFIFWGITLIAYMVFCALLYVIIHSIKDDLIKSLHESEASKDKIEKLAYYDSLTDLPNMFLLEKEYNLMKNKKGHLALVSIRGMNLINSVYGNMMTDKVMEKTAYYLNKIKSEGDLIARIGNDFLWYIQNKNEVEVVMTIENFITLVHHGKDSYGVDFSIIYKIGIVEIEYEDKTIYDWIRKAYSSLEKSKTSSKKVISWYDQETENALKKEELLMEKLSSAIENREFQMYYQEKVDCRDREVIGVEALVRWNSADLGPVSPSEFVPLIDKLQLSVSFGEEVIRLVTNDYSKLKNKYSNKLLISINISPHHLSFDGFIDYIRNEMIDKGVDPDTIIFEITEDNLIKDLDLIEPILSTLHIMGFKLSIDDFGTGYSSLSYLSKLKVDELKIDQTFILNMLEDERTQKLVQAIISLKSIYGFNIIAEGVENVELSKALNDMQCYVHQGFLYSRPSPI